MMKRPLVLVLGLALVSFVACAAPTSGDDEDEGGLSASAALAAASASSYTRAELDAKLFGYFFADGDFYTDDATHAANPRYFPGSVGVTKDVVSLACRAGYVVKVKADTVNCAAQPSVKGQVTVMGFRYPHAANLDGMTAANELRAFFSGLLIGEGSRAGQVDDQFPNVPDGHYTTPAEATAHVALVQRALQRLGFSSAHLTAKSGAACSGSACREVWIDVKKEGCEFAEQNGYTFFSWRRVPGARAQGTDYVSPLPCK